MLFDPYTLVAHATDATDWRLHLPVAVAMPRQQAEVAPLLAAIARLGRSRFIGASHPFLAHG